MPDEDAPMMNAPPTPGGGDDEQEGGVDFSPTTATTTAVAPYDEEFENSLMEVILNLLDKRVDDTSVNRPPTTATATATAATTAATTTAALPASPWPVPLASPSRTHPSPIPGLYLTHANGYHTGGPGPSSQTVKAFADKFMQEHGIEDAGQLERAVESMTREKWEQARSRMRKRKEAVERNKAVERELEDLRLQRSAELRVMEKVKGGKR